MSYTPKQIRVVAQGYIDTLDLEDIQKSAGLGEKKRVYAIACYLRKKGLKLPRYATRGNYILIVEEFRKSNPELIKKGR